MTAPEAARCLPVGADLTAHDHRCPGCAARLSMAVADPGRGDHRRLAGPVTALADVTCLGVPLWWMIDADGIEIAPPRYGPSYGGVVDQAEAARRWCSRWGLELDGVWAGLGGLDGPLALVWSPVRDRTLAEIEAEIPASAPDGGPRFRAVWELNAGADKDLFVRDGGAAAGGRP